MPTESGVYGHQQNHIYIMENFLKRRKWSCRIEHDTGLDPLLFYQLDGAIQVRTGFHMNRNYIGAGTGKIFDICVGVVNHQMHIERQVSCFPYGLNNHWPNSDIGDKMSVHHIHMDPVCARLFNLFHFIRQATKIR